MVLEFVKGYEALKPIIERIMEKPTLTDVNNLNDLLNETSPKALERMQDFILAHLMKNVIDPNVNPELKCSILQCVHTTLENISIASVESIFRLLSFLLSQVFDAKEPTMIRSVPEELKLRVVQCALAVTQNLNEDIRVEMFKPNHVPALSHTVYICVTLAKIEMLQDLRITSMRVVMSLSLIPPIGTPDTSDPQDRKLIADAIQFMLPGIVSNLVNIIRGPVTQGSKITATAVRTLGGVIALVFEDYDWGNSEQSADSIMALVKSSMTENKTDENEEIVNSETVKSRDGDAMQRALTNFKGRTPEWRSSSAKKLLSTLEDIGKLQTHSDWRVRKEVAWVAALVISRCPRSLYDGLSPLLNALLLLKGDDQPEIRQLCLQHISEIQDLFAARTYKNFKELIEENLYNLLTKLPRLVHENCGENTPTILSLLAGYIELLGSDLKLMLSVPVHLQRFSLAILQALVLDSASIVLTPEFSFRELKAENEGGLRAPWICFEHCSDVAALHQISRLVEALSAPQTLDACDLIGRQILALIAAIPSITCEGALFLNELLKTAQGQGLHHLATLALDVYLDPNMYNISIQGELSLSQSRRNVLRICILTEGIGCCIKAMKPDAIQASLLRGLYPVLERAGSANYLIATAGLQALSLIAKVTGHNENLISLVNANMDYISHTLSTRLRRPRENPAVFDALTVLLRHASQDTLPGIRNIVNDVLLRSCDEHKETHAEAHLRVFLTFATCINSWLKGEEDTGQDEFENDDENEILIQVPTETRDQKWRSLDLLLEYHENVIQAEQDVDMEEDCREDSGNELPQSQQPHLLAEQQRAERDTGTEEEGKKQPPPPEILLLESVLRRSLHFVASPDSDIQFLALRTISAGMKALSTFPDVLLPLAHQTWAPLVGRLQRNQPPLIFRTAFGLLCTMADTCKDFLRTRIVKEVFPELISVLESSAKRSLLQDKRSAFRFSQLYKLQKAILSRAGPLCINLQLEGVDFRPLLIASLPYLSCYQPRPLQKHCVNLMFSLKTLDDDLVWWNVATMWGPPSLTTAIKVSPGNADFCAETSILLEQR